MTARDSSTAADLAFQAEIASAKARRDRDQPRHTTSPPSAPSAEGDVPPPEIDDNPV